MTNRGCRNRTLPSRLGVDGLFVGRSDCEASPHRFGCFDLGTTNSAVVNRQRFLCIAAGGTVALAGGYYLSSDKRNYTRADSEPISPGPVPLTPNERQILWLASLAPSGHNTQPWFVKRLGPYHWIVGNDKTRWLPGVDPTQRETILSIGAFLQNMEYAASSLGYVC